MTLYSCINKIYNVRGLSLEDGAIIFNITHAEVIQIETKHDVDPDKALDGPKNPIKEDPPEEIITGPKNNTIDPHKYTKILELIYQSEEILNWIDEYSTIILVSLFSYTFMVLGACM